MTRLTCLTRFALLSLLVHSLGCTGTPTPEPKCGETSNCVECVENADCTEGEACEGGKCVEVDEVVAVCGNGKVETGEACDDGNAAAGDGCEANCTLSPCGGAGACASLDGACIVGVCDVATGTCATGPRNEGQACDDGDACTIATVCSAGVCGGGTGCDDGNACTDDACGASGCVFTPNTAACDDGDACTSGDVCASGSCGGGAVDCNDENPCTDDSCASATGCVNAANTASCDDGLHCNGTDTCAGGSCSVHSGDPCASGVACQSGCNENTDACGQGPGDPCTDDGNPCTADVCNANGECTHVPVTDGTSCNDGLFCNGADTCQSGVCSGHAGDPCVGGGECANLCNEAQDTCARAAGTACTADANPCTRDECNGAGACVHPAATNGTACNDGLLCNGTDSCVGGQCTGHTGNPCAALPECQRKCTEGTGACGNDSAGTACSSAPSGVCYADRCDGAGACGVKWNLYANRAIQTVDHASQVRTPMQNTCGGCHTSWGWNFSIANAETDYSCGADPSYESTTGSILASCWLWRTRDGGGMPQNSPTPFSGRTALMDWYCTNYQ